ncbi:hypothetical protein ABK040_005316 [Willaertia magna]
MTSPFLQLILLLAVIIEAFVFALPTDTNAFQLETYTYKVTTQPSTSLFTVWTAPPSQKILQSKNPPTTPVNSNIKVYMARNEYEPAQIIIRPNSAISSLQVSKPVFGNNIQSELYQVTYINLAAASDSLGTSGMFPDPLTPISDTHTLSNLNANQNYIIWLNLRTLNASSAGDFTASFTITVNGQNYILPIQVHVFNFAIPMKHHIDSQMNLDHQSILSSYGVSGTGTDYWKYVNMIKQWMYDHRLTPNSPLWSGGLTGKGASPYIDYDCNTGKFSDPYGAWGFVDNVNKYLKGNSIDFNNASGIGFSSFMFAGLIDNSCSVDQRTSTFCSISRSATGDWVQGNNPTSAFNTKWWKYMKDTQDYLQSLGLLEISYYYPFNEPQNTNDYDAVAWYSQYIKAKIYANTKYPNAKIDIWVPVLPNFNPSVSWERESKYGEQTWIYFLDSTKPPYFNPITIDHQGVESLVLGWYLWKYRIRGIAYYAFNSWSQNPYTSPALYGQNGNLFMQYPPSTNNQPIAYGSNNHRFVPSIRLELMRDSLETYEYLYLLNGGKAQASSYYPDVDSLVDMVVQSTTGFSRSDDFYYNMRRVIGMKLGGEISSIPLDQLTPPIPHTRALLTGSNFYINFQQVDGSPTASPLIVNGKEYMKIGWSAYSDSNGYGWYGLLDQTKYQYLADTSVNDLQRSIIYDDYGRVQYFEFVVPNAVYNVTVSCGWKGKSYSNNYIAISGHPLINNLNNNGGYIVGTISNLEVRDYKISLNMGIAGQYTMLNYMEIIFVSNVTKPYSPQPQPIPSPRPSSSVPVPKPSTSSIKPQPSPKPSVKPQPTTSFKPNSSPKPSPSRPHPQPSSPKPFVSPKPIASNSTHNNATHSNPPRAISKSLRVSESGASMVSLLFHEIKYQPTLKSLYIGNEHVTLGLTRDKFENVTYMYGYGDASTGSWVELYPCQDFLRSFVSRVGKPFWTLSYSDPVYSNIVYIPFMCPFRTPTGTSVAFIAGDLSVFTLSEVLKDSVSVFGTADAVLLETATENVISSSKMDYATASLKKLRESENLKSVFEIYNSTIKSHNIGCNKDFIFETTLHYISSKRICTDTAIDWTFILYIPKWQVVGEVIVALIVSIAVTIGVIVIGLTTGVILALKMPMQKFLEAMRSVSNMELDKISIDKSYFYELSVIQTSFLNMVNRMKLYRAFIPGFLLAELEENMKNDEEGMDNSSKATDIFSKKSLKSNKVVPLDSLMQKFELGVERKEITILGLKIVNFDLLLREFTLQSLFNFISEMFEVVQKLEKSSKSQIGNFDNGILPLIFNGGISLTDHTLKAAKTAELLKKKLEEMTKKWKKISDNNAGMSMNNFYCELPISIITETVVCGNIGTNDSKTFTVLGGYKNLVEAFKINDKYRIAITLNERANKVCSNNFYTRPLEVVTLQNDLNLCEFTKIYELGESSEIAMDEWMYELQQQETKGKWIVYNEGYKLFEEGKYSRALKKFREFSEKNPDDFVVSNLIVLCECEMKK